YRAKKFNWSFFTPSNIDNYNTSDFSKNIISTIDLHGRKIQSNINIPFIKIFDDGTVEKRIVID
ncbi:MAG: hypothetical protein CMD34_05370, partial [Flavobacteriales bacterium]|nr:hypothetical protein [Flavobacteriales bacterium]